MRTTRCLARIHFTLAGCAGILLLGFPQAGAEPFTYQARVTDNGAPLSDSCDFTFRLYDQPTGGALLGTDASPAVSVVEGLMTTTLDFGPGAFDGSDRYLEIEVNCGSGAAILSPRRAANFTPMAEFALDSGMLGGFPAEEYTHEPPPGPPVYSLIFEVNDPLYGAVVPLELEGATFSQVNNRPHGIPGFGEPPYVSITGDLSSLHPFGMFATVSGYQIGKCSIVIDRISDGVEVLRLTMYEVDVPSAAFGETFADGALQFSQTATFTCRSFQLETGSDIVSVDFDVASASGPAMPPNRQLFTGTPTGGPGALKILGVGQTASNGEPVGTTTIDYNEFSFLAEDIHAISRSPISPLQIDIVDDNPPLETVRTRYIQTQLRVIQAAMTAHEFKWTGIYTFGGAQWQYQNGSDIWTGLWDYTSGTGSFTHP